MKKKKSAVVRGLIRLGNVDVSDFRSLKELHRSSYCDGGILIQFNDKTQMKVTLHRPFWVRRDLVKMKFVSEGNFNGNRSSVRLKVFRKVKIYAKRFIENRR